MSFRVIFITGQGTSDTAIDAMRLGAYDYIIKPLDTAQLRAVVEHALQCRGMMCGPLGLADGEMEGEAPCAAGEAILGRSPPMLEVFKAVGRVAMQDVTVLIRGESGTGKELIARAIYRHGRRSAAPFLAVNCAAIPDTLLESDLFGHEKGAFTGADRLRVGKFEQCTGGTLFLDEIGDMSPLLQGKVLRVLQEQRFERVGGNQTIETDVRIITATNRNLEAMVAEGTFRPDLYYRLNGYTIALPPLRERGGDLLLLMEQFLERYARELGKDVYGVAPAALELLTSYHWPLAWALAPLLFLTAGCSQPSPPSSATPAQTPPPKAMEEPGAPKRSGHVDVHVDRQGGVNVDIERRPTPTDREPPPP